MSRKTFFKIDSFSSVAELQAFKVPSSILDFVENSCQKLANATQKATFGLTEFRLLILSLESEDAVLGLLVDWQCPEVTDKTKVSINVSTSLSLNVAGLASSKVLG